MLLCCAVLCCAVLCCAVLCCAVLCCAVLCCAVLCCAVLAWPDGTSLCMKQTLTFLRRQNLRTMCHLSILAVLQVVASSYNSPCDEQGLACLQPCSSQCTDPPLLMYRTPCVNCQNPLCQFTKLPASTHRSHLVKAQNPPCLCTGTPRTPLLCQCIRAPFHCPGPLFSLYRTPLHISAPYCNLPFKCAEIDPISHGRQGRPSEALQQASVASALFFWSQNHTTNMHQLLFAIASVVNVSKVGQQ